MHPQIDTYSALYRIWKPLIIHKYMAILILAQISTICDHIIRVKGNIKLIIPWLLLLWTVPATERMDQCRNPILRYYTYISLDSTNSNISFPGKLFGTIQIFFWSRLMLHAHNPLNLSIFQTYTGGSKKCISKNDHPIVYLKCPKVQQRIHIFAQKHSPHGSSR